jgi:ribosome-associated heat shock protein Hsp15
MDSTTRLDKWLWAARFFKTRSMAREAVAGGKVQLNGNRAKPGRTLSVGDELRIQRGEDVYTIKIVELTGTRGPAAVAATLYAESDENRLAREKLAAERRLAHEQRGMRERRPDKRERRKIIRFKSNYE